MTVWETVRTRACPSRSETRGTALAVDEELVLIKKHLIRLLLRKIHLLPLEKANSYFYIKTGGAVGFPEASMRALGVPSLPLPYDVSSQNKLTFCRQDSSRRRFPSVILERSEES